MSGYGLLTVLVVIGTTIWVAIDASGRDFSALDGKWALARSWVGWTVGCLLLWIVVFPIYLSQRARAPIRGPEGTTDMDATRQEGPPKGLVILGYITAFAIPLIGFVLGVVVVTRPDRRISKHGVRIIVLSIIVLIVAVAAITTSVNRQVHKAQQTLTTELNAIKQHAEEEQADLKQRAYEDEKHAAEEQRATQERLRAIQRKGEEEQARIAQEGKETQRHIEEQGRESQEAIQKESSMP